MSVAPRGGTTVSRQGGQEVDVENPHATGLACLLSAPRDAAVRLLRHAWAPPARCMGNAWGLV